MKTLWGSLAALTAVSLMRQGSPNAFSFTWKGAEPRTDRIPRRSDGQPVLVIACGESKIKTQKAVPARQLYAEGLWAVYRKNLGAVQGANGDHPYLRVIVMSAKHGLIPEGTRITPYNRYLVEDGKVKAPHHREIKDILPLLLRQKAELKLPDNIFFVGSAKYGRALRRAGFHPTDLQSFFPGVKKGQGLQQGGLKWLMCIVRLHKGLPGPKKWPVTGLTPPPLPARKQIGVAAEQADHQVMVQFPALVAAIALKSEREGAKEGQWTKPRLLNLCSIRGYRALRDALTKTMGEPPFSLGLAGRVLVNQSGLESSPIRTGMDYLVRAETYPGLPPLPSTWSRLHIQMEGDMHTLKQYLAPALGASMREVGVLAGIPWSYWPEAYLQSLRDRMPPASVAQTRYANTGLSISCVSPKLNGTVKVAKKHLLPLFIDNGAIQALNQSKPPSPFRGVLSQYRKIAKDWPTAHRDLLSLMGPDVIGKPEKSLKLLREFRNTLRDLRQDGYRMIIPIQAAGMGRVTSQRDLYSNFFCPMMEIAQETGGLAGIPARADSLAWPAFRHFVRWILTYEGAELPVVHLLGMGSAGRTSDWASKYFLLNLLTTFPDLKREMEKAGPEEVAATIMNLDTQSIVGLLQNPKLARQEWLHRLKGAANRSKTTSMAGLLSKLSTDSSSAAMQATTGVLITPSGQAMRKVQCTWGQQERPQRITENLYNTVIHRHWFEQLLLSALGESGDPSSCAIKSLEAEGRSAQWKKQTKVRK